MARAKKPDRFICIEDRERGQLRYRVHAVKDGRRVVEGFRTLEEAEAAAGRVKRATAHLSTPIVEVALEAYFEEMVRRRKWRRDAKVYMSKVGVLRRFFAPVADVPVGMVSEADVVRCCTLWDTDDRPALSTRHNARIRASSFLRWAVSERLLRTSPMTERHYLPAPREQLGRLRLDDARRLRAVVDPAAARGDHSAIFVLAGLLLGARTSELTGLTAASLDDGGRVVHYRDAKDPAKRHVVRLPAVLVAPLRLLAEQAGDGPLLRERGRCPRAWGASAVRHWAGVAGLPMAAEMDARWLRRTKDSLAVEAGVSSEVVARETGHSLHVARMHYIQHGAETTARAAAMDDATSGSGNDSPPNSTESRKQAG